ncbi:MAG: Glu/Leu/Phe/Val dehydrogenase dimerization domain-containing protein [Sphingomonas sp.]
MLVAEHIKLIDRPDVGLKGAIVIHSTALGPAAGGCRLWRYASQQQLVEDAMRLAEGMTYKNALAGLPFGGGKAVLQLPDAPFDRARLFAAFGEEVAALGGDYVTAEDVGTTVADMQQVRSATRHVAGLPAAQERPGGDPSPFTARGVFAALEVALRRHRGRSLEGARVGVQGLGNVGFALCGLLADAGAQLVVADPRGDATERALARFGAEVVPVDAILTADVDVLAPCALGGILNTESIERLRARVICGGANNQLGKPEDGTQLMNRNILYAPDYVANAGGIINVAAEYLGWSGDDVEARLAEIGPRMDAILADAAARAIPPHRAAEDAALGIIMPSRKRRANAG